MKERKVKQAKSVEAEHCFSPAYSPRVGFEFGIQITTEAPLKTYCLYSNPIYALNVWLISHNRN